MMKAKIATIGYFDGVHKGHQFLFEQVCRLGKERGLIPLVYTFYPHPKAYFSGINTPLITTHEERLQRIKDYLRATEKRIAEEGIIDTITKGITSQFAAIAERTATSNCNTIQKARESYLTAIEKGIAEEGIIDTATEGATSQLTAIAERTAEEGLIGDFADDEENGKEGARGDAHLKKARNGQCEEDWEDADLEGNLEGDWEAAQVRCLQFEDIAKKTALDFLKAMKSEGVDVLVMGYNHRFGSDGLQRHEDYVAAGKEAGIEVVLAAEYKGEDFPINYHKGETEKEGNEGALNKNGGDNKNAPSSHKRDAEKEEARPAIKNESEESENAKAEYGARAEHISSSAVRERIIKGDIAGANRMLGGDGYVIAGQVVHGKAIGRTIGFPTANLDVEKEKILPPSGVYGGEVMIDDEVYPTLLNIGKNPTIGNDRTSIEAHIVGYEGDLYGQKICIKIRQRIREERKFQSLAELSSQIEKDKAYLLHKEG